MREGDLEGEGDKGISERHQEIGGVCADVADYDQFVEFDRGMAVGGDEFHIDREKEGEGEESDDDEVDETDGDGGGGNGRGEGAEGEH